MENTTVQTPGTVPLEPPSTVLNPETVKSTSGGGQTPLREAEGSISSVLRAEMASMKGEAEKPVEKPVEVKTEVKPEKPVDKKEVAVKDPSAKKPEAATGAAEKPVAGQEATERSRQSEGREHQQPPARFLPAAKEVYANVPNAVKAEISRAFKEHETELSQYRTSHESYESIREFDEMAKSGNTDLRTALSKYTGMENMLRTNPVQGLAEVMRNIGITPLQYAEHIMKNPQLHEYRPQQQQAPQQPVRSPEIDQLKQEMQAMRHEAVARDIITPFREANPRYDELQEDIAFFLQSGKIPSSLSPIGRLEAAYDMAARINPTSVAADRQAANDIAVTDGPSKPAGTRSIRGAPADGADTAIPERELPLRALLRKEYRSGTGRA